MRYAWHMRQAYFAGRVRGLQQWLVQKLLGQLREWDRRTAARVTHFLAISQTVRERIRECYQREAEVIYPPVDTDFYRPDSGPREDYYLVVSAFAPYKRVDLAIRACERLGRRLVVIGSGQDRTRLQQLAGTQTHFLGWQPDAVIRDHLRRCKALLFPGEEDFGIVPVEAMSCGCPVIALGRGGAAETVIPPGRREEPTGLWFAEQSVEGLMAAVEAFERIERHFSPLAARRQALKFNRHRFREELFAYIDGVLGRRPCVLRRAA
jgi:glycosyltransferase involved in cell wall biosynthesis